MKQEEFLAMTPENQAKIRSSFDFLGDIDITKIGDEQFLTKDGVPLNALTEMKESDFVRDWIIQFALNNTATNTNYFNFLKWGEISNQHTMCVIIVDDNTGDKLFLVKPLSSYELTPLEREVMRQAMGAMSSSIQSTIDGQQPSLSSDQIVAKTEEYVGEGRRTPIHELIPDEFYRKHGVYVEALRKVIWMRDEYFKGQIAQDTLFKVKAIFEKEEIEGCASREEYNYVKSICPIFNIPEDLLEKSVQAKPVENNDDDNNTVVDPWSC